MQPKARTEHLTVRELADETLVYDHQTHKAHCLNPTSALVWKHCDGTRDVATLARVVQEALGTENADAVVRLALEQLSRRKLLAEAVTPPSEQARLSRRAVLRGLVVAAVALPLVTTMTACASSQQSPKVDCSKAKDNTPCDPGFGSGTCCSGGCVSDVLFLSDNSNCGSCGNKCGEGETCENGTCVKDEEPSIPPPPSGCGKVGDPCTCSNGKKGKCASDGRCFCI
jgi:hypothetical protein